MTMVALVRPLVHTMNSLEKSAEGKEMPRVEKEKRKNIDPENGWRRRFTVQDENDDIRWTASAQERTWSTRFAGGE